jgi:hypothetical protein
MKMKRFLVFMAQSYEGGTGLDHFKISLDSISDVERFLEETVSDFDCYLQILDIEKSIMYEANLKENKMRRFKIEEDGEFTQDDNFSISITKIFRIDTGEQS